jgi:V/A-type H+-transporting ATPase subunit I
MKKVAVLVLESDGRAALKELARLGAVHVEHVREPTGEKVERVRTLARKIRLVLDALPADAGAVPTEVEPARTVREVDALLKKKSRLRERLDELLMAERRLAPFGDFDPREAASLRERGVFLSLHRVGPDEPVRYPEDAAVIELSRDKDSLYMAVVSLGAPFQGVPEVVPGPAGLSELREEIRDVSRRMAELDAGVGAYSGDRPKVEELLRRVEKRLEFDEVAAGMGGIELGDRPLVLLEGYVPAEREDDLRAAAGSAGWGLVTREPEEGDEPPTWLRNPAWVRPIKSVFDAVGVLPGYREADVSGPVLLFLSLFFAMLVGDAGYGLLFMVLAALGRARFKSAPKGVFTLLFVMSGCTMVWGALSGNWFGVPDLPAPLAGLRLDWLSGEGAAENVMGLTFLIGAVHLSLAHVWTAVRLAPDPRFLSQLGWLAVTWVMYFAAMSLVLMRPFPQGASWALGLGVAFIVLFTVPPNRIRTQWTDFVMMPLSLISNFVDVVSYVRLFAVGAATFAVAEAFNGMAAGLGGGLLSGLGAALILFFGHALNILLASMGVLVHGVRLNTLEFAGHMGLRWSGHGYAPFRDGRSRDTGEM